MAPSTRPLWQRFMIFLVPLMVSNILQSLSGTINNIYIGQMIGVEALASVSVFFPILILLISFVIGLSAGATVLIGQAWGARNVDKVKQIAGTTLTTAFIGGVFVAIIGVFFTAPIMQVLGAPADILDTATQYGRVMLIGMPGLFVFLIATSILRGVGDTTTPLIALVLSIMVGLVVTPAFIQGWFGLPQLGVMSAAVATIAGFMTVLTFLFFYTRATKHPMAPDAVLLRYLRIDPQVLGLVLKLGVPAGVQMVVGSLTAIVVVGLVNRYGSNATAAYGAVNQVMSYVQFPAMSIAIAASIFGAQAIGAGQADQLGKITRTALIISVLLTGTLVTIAYVFSQHLVELFITDPEVVGITQDLLHIVLWSVLMFGGSSVLAGVMRSSGAVLVPMIVALSAILLVELPLAIILSERIGLHGIWWATAASFCAMLAANAVYYWFFWRKRKVSVLV